MIGKLVDLHMSRDGRLQIVTFATESNFADTFDELCKHDVTIDIKRYYRHRTLEANRFLWRLIGEIAENQNLPKNEVYRKEIVEHGVYRVHCLQNEDVEEECEDWCSFGLGFQVETFPSKIPGCTNVMFYKGSHYYNTKQMAKLIDGVIQDAEALGIPTISDGEKKEMLDDWEKKRVKVDNAG